MIFGIFHQGSGLGNQLHRYVATRALALDKGYDFSMVAPENFKGKNFMRLDMGMTNKTLDLARTVEHASGKIIFPPVFNGSEYVQPRVWEENTSYYNPEFNFVEDNMIIDGEFQDERYFEYRLPEINEWLKVEPYDVPDNLCIIGFRGGEYALYPELFLSLDYWVKGMEMMREERPDMQFRVVTDDPDLAREFFRGFDIEITHEIGTDWRQTRYARYAIIANSSFYILPRLLNGGMTIAPRYWARHNTKEWSMPQNYYKKFTYI